MNSVGPDIAQRPRLALIGPTFPYRGGIAQYTTQLHRALRQRCPLQTISFRRQYPVWLYPGKSDREPGTHPHGENGVDYTLDALNPLTWTAAAHAVAKRGCDLAIIDWWTLFWAPGFALIARMLRKRHVPVAFLCHNLFDHGSGLFKRAAAIKLLAQADAYLVHCEQQADLLRGLFPDKRVVVHPHPTYDRFPLAINPLPQRGRLELLFFGFIRPYKGLDVLIDALARLNDSGVYLTVAGEPWEAAEKLRARLLLKRAPNVELHLSYADDTAVANHFARADLVVLPYRSSAGSGVAAVAFHYDRPVLAARVGGLEDIVVEGRNGFLIDPENAEELAEKIQTLHRKQLGSMREYVHDCKSLFTWNSLADILIGLAQDAHCTAIQIAAPAMPSS